MGNTYAKPTDRHLEWADMELGVIIHYLMDIYNPSCSRYKTNAVRTEMPASIFAPDGWDTDQWMRSAAKMGAKYAVLVANHCTGFSLWQTKVNDYSTASCAFKDGGGDIVREFIESCAKYGIRPGLYYSTGCNGYYNINDEWKHDYFADYYREYVRCVEAQVKELWSEYGELFEIWFDGGIIPLDQGGPNLVPLLEKYQPNALCFQGPKGYPHNLRWVGNEDGLAPPDCFAATNAGEARYDGTVPDEKAGVGDPDGKYYWPAETDMPNRDHGAFGGGWGWKAGEADHVYPPEHLLDCYIRSVGRNSNLLLGMAIGCDGRFEDEVQFEEFGKLLEKTFGDGAKIAEIPGTTALTQALTLDEAVPVKYIVLREDITEGHRVRGFRVLCDGEVVLEGKCLGHKRIVPLVKTCTEAGKPVREIRVEITEYVGEPALRDIALY